MRRLGMPIYSQKEWLTRLLKSDYADGTIDTYSCGVKIEELERRVSTLLDKPAALFFPKGTVAQLCALKVAAEQRDNRRLVLHKMSHMVLDESDAYQALMGLHGITIGKYDSPFGLDDIANLEETFASVSVELPLRRAGFKLTPWEELEAMSKWCKKRKVHFHMDGARLWESSAAYQKSEADISAFFDSVYVSLYKGLGAVGGAVLAGESDFIESCKVWRARLGGSAFTSFPIVIGALDGLDKRRKEIPEWVERAKSIADMLITFPQLSLAKPHTNGFFVFLEGDVEQLSEKANTLSQSMDISLFNQVSPFPNTQKLMIEIQVGANHKDISSKEIQRYFTALLS